MISGGGVGGDSGGGGGRGRVELGNRDSDSDSLWEKVIILDGRRLLPKQGFEPTSSRSVAWLCSCCHPYKGKADHVHRRDQPSF